MNTELITDENLSNLLDKINYSILSNLDEIKIERVVIDNNNVKYNTKIIANNIYYVSCTKRESSFLWIDLSTYRIIVKFGDYEIDSQKMDNKVKLIWETLNNANTYKEVNKSNKKTIEIINDISTIIDKSLIRDDKIEDILK